MATLKEDGLKEKEKHREIVSLLGPMEEEDFAKLSSLGRKITDYGMDKQAATGGMDTETCVEQGYMQLQTHNYTCTCVYTLD